MTKQEMLERVLNIKTGLMYGKVGRRRTKRRRRLPLLSILWPLQCLLYLFILYVHNIVWLFLQICPFPIFTRSGEVSVKLELAGSSVVLTPGNLEKIVTFLNYTFTSVLRLQKYLMMFDPQASENSYFIVPTIKGKLQR
jgi:hypothetical protein